MKSFWELTIVFFFFSMRPFHLLFNYRSNHIKSHLKFELSSFFTWIQLCLLYTYHRSFQPTIFSIRFARLLLTFSLFSNTFLACPKLVRSTQHTDFMSLFLFSLFFSTSPDSTPFRLITAAHLLLRLLWHHQFFPFLPLSWTAFSSHLFVFFTLLFLLYFNFFYIKIENTIFKMTLICNPFFVHKFAQQINQSIKKTICLKCFSN